jgi:hypothetical protein
MMPARQTMALVALLAVAALALGCGKADAVKRDVSFVTKLSDADRKAAVAQKLCPVTEERLGSMGLPIKVVADDQSFFICCESCKDDAMDRFDELYVKAHKPAG